MKEILEQYKIKADIIEEKHLGNISRYSLKLHPGTSLEKIERKAVEIALAAKAYGKPIIYPILHRGIVVLELLNKVPDVIDFNLFDLKKYDHLNIPIIIGKTQDGEDLVIDLTEIPHMLAAGTTGSGKSVLLNSVICSILEAEKNTKLVLIDPKMVEFSCYKDVKNLAYPILHTPEETQDVLDDLIVEMNKRFRRMALDGVSNISEYEEKKFEYMVIVIDEFADLALSSNKEFSNRLCLLAQKARACGIHIITATQRPSAGVINGMIKANFPGRISFKVSSLVDSRVILDRNGAERLTSKGDGFLVSDRHNMVRFRGAYINREDIHNICLKHSIGLKTKIYRTLKGLI